MSIYRRLLALLLAGLALLSSAAAALAAPRENQETFIKWVDFDVPYTALNQAMTYDIETYNKPVHLDWITLLALQATQCGGEFSKSKPGDMDAIARRLLDGEAPEEIAATEHFTYYLEAYGAVLGEFLGEYRVEAPDPEDEEKCIWSESYGLKAYFPLAAGFAFDHFDDFGVSRSYGYTRRHLGHDMFGAVGTPVIAVESGVVEVTGWNQYGGWRIGIRSFDGLRYYYYAHLRQNRPYHCDLAVGQTVKAGDVIGYLGRTGYSATENVNNIDDPHLHWGMQLIFDESQKEGDGEIWVDLYAITRLLSRNRSETYRVAETKEFYRQFDFDEPQLVTKQR